MSTHRPETSPLRGARDADLCMRLEVSRVIRVPPGWTVLLTYVLELPTLKSQPDSCCACSEPVTWPHPTRRQTSSKPRVGLRAAHGTSLIGYQLKRTLDASTGRRPGEQEKKHRGSVVVTARATMTCTYRQASHMPATSEASTAAF